MTKTQKNKNWDFLERRIVDAIPEALSDPAFITMLKRTVFRGQGLTDNTVKRLQTSILNVAERNDLVLMGQLLGLPLKTGRKYRMGGLPNLGEKAGRIFEKIFQLHGFELNYFVDDYDQNALLQSEDHALSIMRRFRSKYDPQCPVFDSTAIIDVPLNLHAKGVEGSNLIEKFAENVLHNPQFFDLFRGFAAAAAISLENAAEPPVITDTIHIAVTPYTRSDEDAELVRQFAGSVFENTEFMALLNGFAAAAQDQWARNYNRAPRPPGLGGTPLGRLLRDF